MEEESEDIKRVISLTEKITSNEIMRFEDFMKSEGGKNILKYIHVNIANACCGGTVILFHAWRKAREEAIAIKAIEDRENDG